MGASDYSPTLGLSPHAPPLLFTLQDCGYADDFESSASILPILENLDAQVLFLMEKLANDLVNAIKTSQGLENRVEELTSEVEQERCEIADLKAHNTELLDQNNCLRSQIEGLERDQLLGWSNTAHTEDERLQQWKTQSLHQLQELERMNHALRVTLSRQTCCQQPSDAAAASKEKPCGGHIVLSHPLAPSKTRSAHEIKFKTHNAKQDEPDRLPENCTETGGAQTAEDELENLQKILMITKEELAAKDQEIKCLQEDIATKDKEIGHLCSMIDATSDTYLQSTNNNNEQKTETDFAKHTKGHALDTEKDKVDNLQLQVERLQATVKEQDCVIAGLRADLAQKVEQLAFITDEKAVGEEALGASQLQCSQLVAIIKELDERMAQLTAAITTRTIERDSAVAAEKRETEARHLAEEGLRKKCNDLSSDLQKSQQQQTRIQIELDEYKRREEEERSKHAQTLEELKKCKKQLALVEKDTEQLKSLIAQLDATREELVGKLKSTMADQHSAESQVTALELEVRTLAEEADIRATELTELHKMLEALGKECDHVHLEMRIQSEKVSQLAEENNRVVAEAMTLGKDLQNTENKLSNESLLLQKAESEILSLKDTLGMEENCRKEAEDRCAAKVVEIQSVTEKLEAVTCKLQITETQLFQVSSARESLVEDLKNLTSRLTYFEQLICAREEEERALSNSYDQLIEEHQQLKLAAIELDAQAQRQAYQIQGMEELLQKTQEQSSFFEEDCKRLKNDLKEMEKQADIMSRSLSQQSSLLENLQKEKTALLTQIASSKQILLELEKKNTTLMRDLAASESNNQLLTGMIQGKIQEAESFITRYKLEHERVREMEQLVACFRAQEHQLQLESKDSGAKNAIMRERLAALEEQVRLLQKSKESQRDEILRLEDLLTDKCGEENRRITSVCAHAHESLMYHNILDSTDSKSKVHELEMRTISLSADLTKTAALYKDCLSRLQKAEAQCAEQRSEYEHVLSILSKVDDDRLQLQQRCIGLVNGAGKTDTSRMLISQAKLESILEQSEKELPGDENEKNGHRTEVKVA